MHCGQQESEYHGCRAFCLSTGGVIADFGELFETCFGKLDDEVSFVCSFHADALNLRSRFRALPIPVRAVLEYMLNPKNPIELFPAFLDSMSFPAAQAAKLLLSPVFFWMLNVEYIGFLFYFGFLGIAKQIPTSFIPDDFSFVYVLDSICGIMGWIISGEEDLQRLGIPNDQLILIKWSKLMYLIQTGLLMQLGCFDTLQICPTFSLVWKDRWNERCAKYWMPIFEDAFPESAVEQIADMLQTLIQVVQFAANEGFRKPGDPKLLLRESEIAYDRFREFQNKLI